MNLIGGLNIDLPLLVADSLATDPGVRFDIILTNPPFGKKSSRVRQPSSDNHPDSAGSNNFLVDYNLSDSLPP